MKTKIQKINGFGKSALILGIIGIFAFPFVCSTLAIIFGAIGMNKEQKHAKAGLVLGIIGWCAMLLMFLLLL